MALNAVGGVDLAVPLVQSPIGGTANKAVKGRPRHPLQRAHEPAATTPTTIIIIIIKFAK
jgi:hypothetical protein